MAAMRPSEVDQENNGGAREDQELFQPGGSLGSASRARKPGPSARIGGGLYISGDDAIICCGEPSRIADEEQSTQQCVALR